MSVPSGLNYCLFSLSVQRFGFRDLVFSFAEARQISNPSVIVQFNGLMMTQSSEEIVVMTAALDQEITLQSETNVDIPHPPRSPAAHPIWTP